MLLLNSLDSGAASSSGEASSEGSKRKNLINRLREMLTKQPPISENVQRRINFLSEGAPDDRLKGILQTLGNDELDRLIRSSDCMVYKKSPDGKNIPDDDAIRVKLLNHYYPLERGLVH